MTQTTATSPYRSLDDAHGNNELLDMLLAKGPKNDAALARALEVAPPVISKIRHGRLPVGASLLIRMHEVFDVSIGELKRIARAEVMRHAPEPTAFDSLPAQTLADKGSKWVSRWTQVVLK